MSQLITHRQLQGITHTHTPMHVHTHTHTPGVCQHAAQCPRGRGVSSAAPPCFPPAAGSPQSAALPAAATEAHLYRTQCQSESQHSLLGLPWLQCITTQQHHQEHYIKVWLRTAYSCSCVGTMFRHNKLVPCIMASTPPKMRLNPPKMVNGCLSGGATKETVTHSIFSPNGLHWSVYNCLHSG